MYLVTFEARVRGGAPHVLHGQNGPYKVTKHGLYITNSNRVDAGRCTNRSSKLISEISTRNVPQILPCASVF